MKCAKKKVVKKNTLKKKVSRKVKYHGRSASENSKDSKVLKLKRLAKNRSRRKKKKLFGLFWEDNFIKKLFLF